MNLDIELRTVIEHGDTYIQGRIFDLKFEENQSTSRQVNRFFMVHDTEAVAQILSKLIHPIYLERDQPPTFDDLTSPENHQSLSIFAGICHGVATQARRNHRAWLCELAFRTRMFLKHGSSPKK